LDIFPLGEILNGIFRRKGNSIHLVQLPNDITAGQTFLLKVCTGSSHYF